MGTLLPGVYVCAGEAWRTVGLPPGPPPQTHTNWFGHPCTCLALLAELAWSGHQAGGDSGHKERCAGLEGDVFATEFGWQ